MPGLVNAYTRIGTPARDPATVAFSPELASLAIANMLKAGITTFCEVGLFPERGGARGRGAGPARRHRAARRAGSESVGTKCRRSI